MEYEEFVVELRRGAGDRRYHVMARSSSDGDVEGELVLTERLATARPRVRHVRDSSPRVSRDTRDVVLRSVMPPRDFGHVLFRSLFSAPVGEHFAKTRGAAHQRQRGVRVCIRTSEPALMAIPWELLYSTGDHRFLSQSEETPVVRCFSVAKPLRPIECTLPLKVLLVLSNDPDRPLDLGEEEKRIRNELRELVRGGFVKIECLVGPTRNQLLKALRREKWHVLHYAGHGGYDAVTNEGQLQLKNPNGVGVPLYANDLGLLLGHQSSLRLVILNSCDGARATSEASAANTAARLMEHGVPAVVAMQYEIGDDAATLFAQEIYRAVALEQPIDEAMTNARKAMYLEDSEEWATPVLYLRGGDATLLRTRRRMPLGRFIAASVAVGAAAAIPIALATHGWPSGLFQGGSNASAVAAPPSPAADPPAPSASGAGAAKTSAPAAKGDESPDEAARRTPTITAAPRSAFAPLASSDARSLSVAPNGDVVVGKAPPDFTAPASGGQTVHLSELRGRQVVVFFFPKSGSSCAESCGFRDVYYRLNQKGVSIVGVSGDTDEWLHRYVEYHKIQFPLVSDPNGHLAGAFGVPFHDGHPEAQTFIVGEDGKVKKIYRAVAEPKSHAHDVAVDVGAVR